MAVATLMLTIGIAQQAFSARCFETSISAYYWTADHPVLLAALGAIGLGLIVNKGSSYLEDVLLNASGFFAFGVAVVPTPRGPSCGGPGLPLGMDVGPLVRNAGLAIILTSVVAEVLMIVVASGPPTRAQRWVRPVSWVAAAGFLAWYVASASTFLLYAHVASALVMFVGIILVVLINGVGARQVGERRFASAYFWTAAAMAATVVGTLTLGWLGGQWSHLVIAVEALLIVEFMAFWIMQTIELWDVSDRSDLPLRDA